MISHYVPMFTRRNGRKEEAVCGAWVRSGEHSAEPTCARCAEWVAGSAAREAEDVETMKALAAEFPEFGSMFGGDHGNK